MDPLTQAALGAAIGQAGFHRTLGRHAALWGAVGGLLPDVDVFLIGLLGPLAEWRYHRGVTHALWFGPVVGTLLGYLLWRWYGRLPASTRAGPRAGRGTWIALLVLALTTHPLLDLFTVYGTQLLAPFSERRFTLSGVPIIDPAYTLPLLAAVAVGLLAPRRARLATMAAAAALGLTTAYLFVGVRQNGLAEAEARRQLAAGGVTVERVRAYTTIFQVWLRRVVVRTPEEVRIGYLSTWRPGPIRWRREPVDRDPLVARLRETPEGRLFEWFSDGESLPRVARSEAGTTVELTDLRFGLPGANELGFWGLRGHFDRDGRLTAAPERFAIPRRVEPGAVTALVRATLGLETDRY